MDQRRDMFVFSCYKGGLRISNVLTLKWCEFDGKVICKICRKTGKELYVPVPTKGLEILEKYRPFKSGDHDFVFPALKRKPKLKDYKSTKKHPKVVHKVISSNTACANKNLHTMAHKLGIPFNSGVSHFKTYIWCTSNSERDDASPTTKGDGSFQNHSDHGICQPCQY